MSKHTPGPWVLDDYNDTSFIIRDKAEEMYEALKQMAYCASHQCGFGCNVEKCPKPLKIQALLARIEGGE